MSTSKSSSVVKKKKRLVQLRDAQRRRRERLKEGKRFFVQIILPEETLLRLNQIVDETGETMQQLIARLVESALPERAGDSIGQVTRTTPIPMEVDSFSDAEAEFEEEIDRVPVVEDDSRLASEPLPLAADSAEQEPSVDRTRRPQERTSGRDQLDLFG